MLSSRHVSNLKIEIILINIAKDKKRNKVRNLKEIPSLEWNNWMIICPLWCMSAMSETKAKTQSTINLIVCICLPKSRVRLNLMRRSLWGIILYNKIKTMKKWKKINLAICKWIWSSINFKIWKNHYSNQF